MLKTIHVRLMGGALALSVAHAAHGALMAPGSLVGAAATANDPSAGTLLSSSSQNFSAALFSGTLTQEVRQESILANPLGGLTFTYLVSNDGTSATEIKRLISASFGSFNTDVSIFGSGQAPLSFDRGANGVVVGMNFDLPGNALDAGETSTLLVVRTNAASFTSGVISVIDGGSANVVGAAPIPEPGAVGLIAIASFALLARRRREHV